VVSWRAIGALGTPPSAAMPPHTRPKVEGDFLNHQKKSQVGAVTLIGGGKRQARRRRSKLLLQEGGLTGWLVKSIREEKGGNSVPKRQGSINSGADNAPPQMQNCHKKWENKPWGVGQGTWGPVRYAFNRIITQSTSARSASKKGEEKSSVHLYYDALGKGS